MSVRRKTASRRTLFRRCVTCEKEFVTTADSPWLRQLPRDGKRQANTYFCSSKCFQDSYKHIGWYDGKAEERRREKASARDVREKNRQYYASHAEQMRERAMARYWSSPERAREAMTYSRKKRKLLEAEST